VEALPLPTDPVLRDAAARLEERRLVAEIWDSRWRLAYMTRDYMLSCGTTAERAAAGIGTTIYGQDSFALRTSWPGFATTDSWLASLTRLLPLIANDVPGGIEELRAGIVPQLLGELDHVVPRQADSMTLEGGEIKLGSRTTEFATVGMRLLDGQGALAGTVFLVLPAVSGSVLSLLATADHRALEGLLDVIAPARRPAAVLFADLEGSSALARSLPAEQYFRLIRRLVSQMDAESVECGALVGKHAGDGMTALFLAQRHPSESATARVCIETARAIRAATAEVAARSGLDPAAVSVRFGLHWGGTLYVGGVLTRGRADVTALGDEMNEAARIEASATGGRILASKSLIERLDADDAEALGLRHVTYVPLGDLTAASAKALRDAPAIPVCEI